MPTSRRTLTSLPSDVLTEILKLLLLDTPRSPQRAAVLRTCSLLLDLGLPLLYRVVDLTGMNKRSTLLIHWKRLFGEGGLFAVGTKTGREIEDVGSFVRELRLGGGAYSETGRGEDFPIPSLDLPLCSTLLFNPTPLWDYAYLPLERIISQFHTTHLVVTDRRREAGWGDCFPIDNIGLIKLAECLGIADQPWENLETLIFRGCIWSDRDLGGGTRLSCSDLPYKVLVVEVPAGSPTARVDEALALFLPSDLLGEDERYLENLERIEFRIRGEIASAVEESFREEARKRAAKGLSSLEKRLLPLFIFVSEDGEERRFEDLE